MDKLGGIYNNRVYDGRSRTSGSLVCSRGFGGLGELAPIATVAALTCEDERRTIGFIDNGGLRL